MISISSKTGSTDGVVFQEHKDSVLDRREPRISKAKTLDLNVSIDFRGYVKGDWEKNIKAILSDEQAEALKDIIENETYVNLSDRTGFFDGVIARCSIDNGDLNMDFWVRS